MATRHTLPPDRETLEDVGIRMAVAVALFVAGRVDLVDDEPAKAGTMVFAVLSVVQLVGWYRSTDTDYETQLTKAGNATARARREEAKELSAYIRAERRRVKARRKLERSQNRSRITS